MATGGNLGSLQNDASDALHDYTCAPCSDDGKNTEAMFQCTDCQIFYCQRCVTGHNKFTKNHNVVDKASKFFGQDKRQTGSVTSSALPTNLCEEHLGQVIQMFCGQHDTVCCTICIAVKHRSCEGVDYIPNIAKGLLKTQDKAKTKTSLEKVKDDLQSLKSRRQNELKKLRTQRDDIIDEIHQSKKRTFERVEELAKISIKEVQDKHKEIDDAVTVSINNIDGMMKDVELELEKFRHSNSDNEAQTFVDIKYGEKTLSDVNDCVKKYLATVSETLEFEVNNSIDTCLNALQCLGKLTVGITDNVLGSLSMDDFPEQNALPQHTEQYGNSVTSPIPCVPDERQTYLGVNSKSTAHTDYNSCPSPSFSFDSPTTTASNGSRINPKAVTSTTTSSGGPMFGSRSTRQPSRRNIFEKPVTSSSLFGAPATSSRHFANSPFGPPVTSNGLFGTPSAANSHFGTPVTRSGLFGTSGAASNLFDFSGTPVTQSGHFGAPGAENRSFGPSGTPFAQSSLFGTPGAANSHFGTPVSQNSLFGTPGAANSHFGTPVSQNSLFGTPGAASPFGAPDTSRSIFEAPVTANNHF
ncbi:uncharacterized protein LOC123538399 [Mercenaria mercenaria]|uniref:uncharacterized protein LOC123538399 n=1 Tax=Mercenaria mercenaria TaxID=6596 RepID=UPI00234E4B32|nr:uncharacterized protein LOC123538399 [Mercenaria mercenaria]